MGEDETKKKAAEKDRDRSHGAIPKSAVRTDGGKAYVFRCGMAKSSAGARLGMTAAQRLRSWPA